MLSSHNQETPRPLSEIAELIEKYPGNWRRWCSSPERSGCFCMGCVRQPAPSTVSGDPEYARWPNPQDALSEEEVELYLRHNPTPPSDTTLVDGGLYFKMKE